jgi:hypothetical protein
MWDISKLYISAYSNSVQLVPVHPIIISILFHHYKELKECMEDIKQIEEQKGETSVCYDSNQRIERRRAT